MATGIAARALVRIGERVTLTHGGLQYPARIVEHVPMIVGGMGYLVAVELDGGLHYVHASRGMVSA